MAADLPPNARGRRAIEISSVLTAIALAVVFLRLYTRFFIVRHAGMEDYCMILSMVGSIGVTIAIGYQVKWGLGRHLYTIDPAEGEKSIKAIWASIICYGACMAGQKTSILLQYIRVFTIKRFQNICWAMIGVIALFGIWTVMGNVFICIPLSAFWTHKPGAKCLNQFAMWFANAAINILMDLIIFLLPIPVIRNLNLSKRQKAALMGVFAVGGFVCIISILRMPQLVAISNSTDPTYDNVSAATWSSIECNVGIICACLPIIRPLIAQYLPGVLSSHKRSIHTTPRPYSTIGATRRKNDFESRNVYAMSSTTRHPELGEDDQEIQVVTDIRVQVQGDEGNISNWKSDISCKEWSAVSIPKKAQRSNSTHSSTDTLFKERGRIP